MMFKLFVLAGVAIASAQPVAPGAMVNLPRFAAIELVGGGTVVLRHGPTQRVTLDDGGPRRTTMAVSQGGKLTITGCGGSCSGRTTPLIDITASAIDTLAVRGGGHIRSEGPWPAQRELTVAAGGGGRIDVAGIGADDVAAAVTNGGSIRVSPRSALTAVTTRGGSIRYRGTPRVVRITNGGGTVERIRD